jgi:hypothetical protein
VACRTSEADDPLSKAGVLKVDGLLGLVVFPPNRILELRNRQDVVRDWLRGGAFENP